MRPSLEETRKTVTVVFCDVVGSTSLGDRLDPEALRQVMTRFYVAMREALERHGGSVQKYIGDAVMAVFGIPRLHEDDALRAVRAAQEMREALERLNEELAAGWDVRLQTRIGINTGEVVVGDAAAGEALVLGDAVNVAARLEQAAGVGSVLMGAETYALVRDHVEAEPVEPMELKGKPGLVHAYRLVAARPVEAPAMRPEPPLVGRSEELAVLRAGFDRAVAKGSAVLATVLGPAGIGKSRLAREVVAGLDALVVTGRCLPYGDGITFWPIAEIVKQASAVADDDPAEVARAKIEAAITGAEDAATVQERLAGLLGISDAPAAELQETFWAVRRFLERLGERRPVVVVLDDLQWAEPTLLDLVEYLAGWTRQTALFLLCLARPDLLELRPSWGTVGWPSSSVTLDPLDEQESRRLVSGLLEGLPLDDAAMDRIAAAAGGNALFLEEMLRMLEDEELIRREEDRWVAVGDVSRLTIPGSIHALLGARLDRLPEQERTVIRSAAVIGKIFWWGAVAELAPEELRPSVGAILQSLVRKDLIRPDRSSFAGHDGFRFHHILVQEAAYRSTPKEQRASLHARFADWMAEAAGERVAEYQEVIGYHRERAHRYGSELGAPREALRQLAEGAAAALDAGGRRALERRDVTAAADLLSRAAALVPADAVARRSIQLGLGEALSEIGELQTAERALEEAERLADEAGDDRTAAQAALLHLDLLQSTDPQRLGVDAQSRVEGLIATLEQLGDHAGVARGWRLLADLHWAGSRYAAVDDALVQALGHARRAGDVREEIECLGRYVGSGAYGPADVREVERRCEELLEAAGGRAGREAPALRALAIVRAMEGRFDEARDLAGRARAILEEFGFRLRASWVSETLGAIEMLAGHPAAAERAFRAGVEAAAEVGEQGFQATAAALLAHALVEQDRMEEAAGFAELSASSAAEEDVASQVLWRTARARILASAGSTEQAERIAREAVGRAEATDDINMHADALVDLAQVLLAAERRAEAADALNRAIPLYERKGNAVAAEAARRRTRVVS